MKTMNKSRVAFLVCLLVLALALTSILALNVFADDEVEDVATEWTGYSLVLTDGTDIVLQGTISQVDEEDSEDYYVSYDFCEGENIRVDFRSGAGGRFEVPIRVAHGQMNDTITARIIVDGETVDEVEVSVKSYCASILNDEVIVETEVADGEEAPTENAPEFKTLVSELLRYGAAAYNYLGETEEATALLDGLTLTDALVFPENPAYIFEKVSEIAEGTTAIAGVSVVDITSMKLTLNNFLSVTFGTNVNLEDVLNYSNLDEDGNMVNDTHKLSDFFNYESICVIEGLGAGKEVSDRYHISPSYYAYAMKDDEEVGELVKALYNCALAAHTAVGHNYIEYIDTAATCQNDGHSVLACDCGASYEVTVAKNDTHPEIELINGNGGFVGYKCAACDTLWAAVSGLMIFDGTDDSFTGMQSVDTAYTATGLPTLNNGRYDWVRMEGADPKDQNQLWYQFGGKDDVAFTAKDEYKFIMNIDLEPIGTPCDAEGEREILSLNLVTDRNQTQGLDRWGPKHQTPQKLLRWNDDGTLVGWNNIIIGEVAPEGTTTNVTVVLVAGEGELGGKTVPMLYATYYVNGVGICTTGIENTLRDGGFGYIYANGYNTDDFEGYSFDNLWFGWTNGEITVQEMSACGTIKYLDADGNLVTGGSHTWVETVTKEPTCDETGTKELACSCGATQSAVAIPKLPHTYDFTQTVVTRPEGTELNHTTPAHKAPASTITYKCTTCSKDVAYEVIDARDFSDDCPCGYVHWLPKDAATVIDYSNDYASIIAAINENTFNDNVFIRISAANQGYTLTDKNTVVIGFDIAMPEGGFPENGVNLQAKVEGKWGSGADILVFKDAAVYVNGRGEKIADVTAGQWLNFVVKATLAETTVDYEIYMNGAFVKSFSQARNAEITGDTAFNNGSSEYQLNIARTGTNNADATRGMLVDNVFIAEALPTAFGHVCAGTTYEQDDTTHTLKCDICGATLDAGEHDYTWTVTKEATCAEVGKKVGTCKCGKEVQEDIAKLAHTIAIDTENTVFGTTEHTGAACAPAGTLVYACSECDYAYTIEGVVRNFNDGCKCGQLQNNWTDYPVDYSNGYAAILGAFCHGTANESADSATAANGTGNVYVQIQPSKDGATLVDPTVMAFSFDVAMPKDGFSENGIELNGKLGGWANNGSIIAFKDGKFLANREEVATLVAEEWHNYTILVSLTDVVACDKATSTTGSYKANYTVYMDGVVVKTFTRSNTIPANDDGVAISTALAANGTGFNTTENWYFQLNIAGNKNNVTATRGMLVDNVTIASAIDLEHTCIAGSEAVTGADGHAYNPCVICGEAVVVDAHVLTASVADNQITYACSVCDYAWTSTNILANHDGSASPYKAASNATFEGSDADGSVPIKTEGEDENANDYYAFVATTGAQGQIWTAGCKGATAAVAGRSYVFSVAVKGAETGWSARPVEFQLANRNGDWTGTTNEDGTRDGMKGQQILWGDADGKTYKTANKKALVVASTDEWTQIDVVITLDAETDLFTLVYYVNGECVAIETLQCGLLVNTAADVYICGNAAAAGEAVYLDNIVFAVCDPAAE